MEFANLTKFHCPFAFAVMSLLNLPRLAVPRLVQRVFYHGMSKARDVADAQVIDLRSDVLTQPSPAIRKALSEGSAKDDVFNEDPTVKSM
jgi:hypothetical protein